MADIKVVEEKNSVKVNPKDTNVIAVQEIKNYVEVSASGPQGIAGPAGVAGAQGPKGTYTVSETAPASPNNGDTWFNSTTSQMYIRYDGYWVETSTSYAGLNGNDGQGFTYQGTYSSSTTYNYYDVVTYNGSSYICMANNVYANQPDSSQFWAVMAQKGETGATGTLSGKYGAFEYTGRQAVTDATLAYTFPWNTTDFSNGITTSNTTRINFATAGTYNIQWSGQFQNTNNVDKDIFVWLSINGTDVVGSTGVATIPGSHGAVNGHTIVGWNYFLSFTAGQYLEIKWAAETTAVSLESYAAGTSPTRPTTAALILTAQQVA